MRARKTVEGALERRDHADQELRRVMGNDEWRELEEIDWSEPNEANGFYPKGRKGSVWWLEERKASAVEIIVERVTYEYDYLELPKRNPFPDHLSAEEWREARRRITDKYREHAQDLLEEAWRYGKFLEGKDLDYAAHVAGEKAFRESKQERLREYVSAARDAAEVFHRLAAALKTLHDERGANVSALDEKG